MDVLERIFNIAQKYSVELKSDTKEESNVEFAEAKLADGTTITTPAEAMEVGVEVFVVNADGEQMPVPDGTYTLENGAEIMVAAGIIEAINEAPEEVPAEEPEVEVEASEEVEAAEEEKEEMTLESIKALIAEKVEEEMKKYREEMSAQAEKMSKMEESFSAKRPAKAKVRKTEQVNLKELNDKNRVTALFNRYYNG